MKKLLLLLTLSVLFQFCTKELKNNLPFEFGQEYFFIVDNSNHNFEKIHANTIRFFEDGSYTRTEDTAHRDFNNPIEYIVYMIKFSDIRGNWKFTGGEVILNDTNFGDYTIYNSFGEVLDIAIPFNKIQLGTKEKINNGKVCKIEGGVVYYDE